MIYGLKFLAVLDDDYFKDSLYSITSSLDGIADIIWYRFKHVQNDNKLIQIRNIITKSTLVLSENYKLAIKFNYDGVHLNKNSINNYNVIKSTTNLLVGYSSHSTNEIKNINADYYTLSPIYDTPKNYQVKPLGIIKYDKNKKVFALGGISLQNINNIKGNFYGFAGIRIISDIIKSSF